MAKFIEIQGAHYNLDLVFKINNPRLYNGRWVFNLILIDAECNEKYINIHHDNEEELKNIYNKLIAALPKVSAQNQE